MDGGFGCCEWKQIRSPMWEVTPHVGGSSMRYDPLPARMVSQRRRLRFVYFDGAAPRALTLGEVRELTMA
jgi:hypothetical protein